MDYQLGNTILYLDKVELGYGKGSNYKCILKDVTLEEKDVIGKGQIIAIVGRSGRGKSTLFKALTGLVKPRSGRILISENEKENNAKEVVEGSVGFVDQKYTLFRHKTVYQSLFSALRRSKLTDDQKDAEIKKHLTEWGLIAQAKQYPNELSGGQRQRTAIIEQILSSGHFMVLDEPFSGLDVGNIRNVKNSFELIHTGHELNTIIYSTHDMKLAVELSDSIYVVGYPDESRSFATIVKHFDLKKLGVAWTKFGPAHIDIMEQVEEALMQS